MDERESLNHTKSECKRHVIFVPKYRRKMLWRELRGHLRGCSDGWQSRGRAGSRKDICCPPTCT